MVTTEIFYASFDTINYSDDVVGRRTSWMICFYFDTLYDCDRRKDGRTNGIATANATLTCNAPRGNKSTNYF